MKNYIKYCLILFSLLYSFPIHPQTTPTAERVDSLILGNCKKKIVDFENIYNDSKKGGAALYFPESTMQMFKECQITSLYLGIDNFKGTESLEIFISHQLEPPYDYVQSVIPTQNNWNKFSLNAPFKLDGKPIYIGYTFKGRLLSYTEKKETGEEWINQRNDEWVKYTKNYSTALYAIVEGGNKLPPHNIRLKNIKMPYYALTHSPIPFSGSISNLGTETIQNLEFTYQVGKQTYKEKLEGVNIPSQSEIEFSINGLKLTEEEKSNLILSITAVNGQPDQDMTDNNSPTVELLCRHHFTPRKVLLEVFTSESCPNCPNAHQMISESLKENNRIIELQHHAGFYDDRFTIDASKEYEWFYKTDYLYAPAQMLDRHNMHDNYPSYFLPETPVISVSDKTFATTCSEAMNIPAFASLYLSVEKVDENKRQIKIHVNGESLLPIPESGNDRLFIFLTEDSIYSPTQSGASKDFYHNHTARQCITPIWGDSIDISRGYEAEYMVQIPEKWNADQMKVIAFVGNYDAEDKNNCRIYNTESIDLKSLLPASISYPHANTLSIMQRGRHIFISGGYITAKIYTTDGKCVLSDSESKEQLSLDMLPKGNYILQVYTKYLHRTLKIHI